MKTPLWKNISIFCQNKGFIVIKVKIIMIKIYAYMWQTVQTYPQFLLGM